MLLGFDLRRALRSRLGQRCRGRAFATEHSAEIGAVDLVDDEEVLTPLCLFVSAQNVAGADVEREASADRARKQAHDEATITKEPENGSCKRAHAMVPVGECVVTSLARAIAPDVAGVLFIDMDALLERLPAAARAQLKWIRQPMIEALAALRREPLTDELIERVGVFYTGALLSFAHCAIPFVSNLIDQRSAVMSELAKDQAQLAAFLDSDDARDTLAWASDLVRSYIVQSIALLQAHPDLVRESAAIDIKDLPAALKHFGAGVLALMAAAEESRKGEDRRRASDLIDVCFLELMQFRDAARGEGFWIDLFPTDTTAQRNERLGRSLDQLRRTLSVDDWVAIEDARLRDLR